MKLWKTLSRREICHPNSFLKVELRCVQLPGGKRIEDWPYVVTPDYAVMVVRDGEGKFLCFRQTKYAVEGTTLAPVGGFLEPGEDPQTGARRELLEETGYTAAHWKSLGNYPVDANRGCGVAHLFVAWGACKTAERGEGDLEEQELVFLTHDEMAQALMEGQFKALPWAAVVAMGLRYLETQA
jgi:ADP-ribose pyrophosphatase